MNLKFWTWFRKRKSTPVYVAPDIAMPAYNEFVLESRRQMANWQSEYHAREAERQREDLLATLDAVSSTLDSSNIVDPSSGLSDSSWSGGGGDFSGGGASDSWSSD